MRKILIIILVTTCFFNAKAQLKDYFIPTNQYFNKTFLFQSEKWENENGQFQSKNKVTYYLDDSGNYKKYIENTLYRYNVLKYTLRVHQFYYVSNEKVADIYFYIEGISDGQENRDHNRIILKYPPSKWTTNPEGDIVGHFESKFGSLTTEYGEYDDCIIVTKTSESKTKESKWAEDFIYKYYYAKDVGLVKTENYLNGKLLKEEFGYGGTLVDNFSEYSFYQREKRLAAKKRRDEERLNLLAFLEERKTTIYDYEKVKSNDYSKIEKDIKSSINNIIEQNKVDNISFIIEANYSIDTMFNQSQKINIINLENSDVKQILTDYLASISLSHTYLNKYSVNSNANFILNFNKFTNELLIIRDKNGLTLKKGNHDVFVKNKFYIYNEISGNPYGKYKIRLTNTEINNDSKVSLDYLNYKNNGGSLYSVLSLMVPGTGDYFVNGGKGSMLGKKVHPIITTIGVYGLIGTGLLLKSQSSNNYNLYHQAIKQVDINKYYDLANSQNKMAWTFFGFGGAVWLVDIYWVIKKGASNKKIEEKTKKKLNIAFVPLFNKSYAFNITYNF